jgi:hypothetical protein
MRPGYPPRASVRVMRLWKPHDPGRSCLPCTIQHYVTNETDSQNAGALARTVTCPVKLTVPITPRSGGGGLARFGRACAVCPLALQCTASRAGRTISIHPHETLLTRARQRQRNPAWQADYRATRPRVERKLAHLLRRQHGGRRARVRGLLRVGQDWRLLAAAVNLARLAVLGVGHRQGDWMVAGA